MADGRPMVLVLDDDLAVRESLKFALQLDGLEVHVCRSGADLLAYELLARAQCLVLVDRLPVMDGFKVLAALRARALPLPVILITAHATEAIRRRAAACGVRHVVEKPFLDNALIDSLRDVLGAATWNP
jgi:FixJ family two-component response regulator